MIFGSLVFNYWAILVAAVIVFVTGFLWFGPIFGKVWAKEMGLTKKEAEEGSKKGMGKRVVANFVGNLICVYVVAHFVSFLGLREAIGAVQLGFWIWIGFFLATTLLSGLLWEGKSFKIFWINAIYWLVAMLEISLILTLWN